MPNPLSKVRPNAQPNFWHGALNSRPKLALRVAELIAAWARTEAAMGALLAHMFGADARTGIAMFQAITSGTARNDVLRAAAEASMTTTHLEFYEAILFYLRPAVGLRNDVAHHIWGTCEELPNAALLTDPKVWAHYALATIEAAEEMMRNPTPPPASEFNRFRDASPPFPLESVMVYRKKDFRDATAIALNAARFLNYLALMVRWPNNVGLHRLLLNEPLFVKAQSALALKRSRKAAPP